MSSHDPFTPLVERTDAKIRYAELQLDHLVKFAGNGSTDVDRAFYESILFHLLGAKDAFLQELNAYYQAGLAPNRVAQNSLRLALKSQDKQSAELREIYQLETSDASWLSHAKQMRDSATHISGVARKFHLGGPNDRKVFLRNPSTGQHVELHAPEALAEWVKSMRVLLVRLRQSARLANAL